MTNHLGNDNSDGDSNFHRNTMQQDGFTLYSRNNNSKNKRKNSSAGEITPTIAKKRSLGGGFKYKMSDKAQKRVQQDNNIDLLIQRMKESVKEYLDRMKETNFVDFVTKHFQTFYQKERRNIEKGRSNSKRRELDLICYGIGDLFTSNIAQMQFASFLLLKQELLLENQKLVMLKNDDCGDEEMNDKDETVKFEIVNCFVYDPIMLLNHSQVLLCDDEKSEGTAGADGQVLNRILHEEYGVNWALENDECKRVCERETLFFMPHCSKQMYCNVIASNLNQLDRVFICGNSFSSYSMRDGNSHKTLLSLLEVEHCWSLSSPSSSRRRSDKSRQLIFESFNDTAVHWTRKHGSVQLSMEEINGDTNDQELISVQRLEESLGK